MKKENKKIPSFDYCVGKIPWRRAWQPAPVLLPGESHGQRSLVGYSPWGRKESDTADRPSTAHSRALSIISLYISQLMLKNTFPFWVDSSPLLLHLFDSHPSEEHLNCVVPNSHDLPVGCMCYFGHKRFGVPLWKIVWFLKNLEIDLVYDPAIPLLGIHTEETRSERDTCTPMFIAALFITARTWKQPKCPSADEW